jgi:glycosyltransferase involved in cell wall biosynthesis
MPVHNASRYLREALDSLRAQTHTDFEIVLVDDGSDDGSLAIAQEYEQRDPRLRVLPRRRAGIVAALNYGLAECRGEFVARMDGDDVALPLRFSAQVAFLRSHPDHVAVGCAQLLIDPDGEPISTLVYAPEHEAIHAEHLSGVPGAISHPASMLRRAAMVRVGGYLPESEYLEDYCLFLRLGEIGRLANLDEVLHCYRQHHTNVHFTHYELQASRAVRIVQDARRRAGLPFIEGLIWDGYVRTGAGDRHHSWALAAAGAGHHRTALKHAARGLRHRPASARSWYVLLRALLPSRVAQALRLKLKERRSRS